MEEIKNAFQGIWEKCLQISPEDPYTCFATIIRDSTIDECSRAVKAYGSNAQNDLLKRKFYVKRSETGQP